MIDYNESASQKRSSLSMRDILPRDFRSLIERAKTGHSFQIDCSGMPVAAIIPIADYMLLLTLDEHPEIKAQLEALMSRSGKGN